MASTTSSPVGGSRSVAARVAERLLTSLATVLAVAVATFALVHSAPGGPFSRERSLPPQVEENLKRRYHLDQPVALQFLGWLGHAARGDLGPSFTQPDRTVNDVIRDGLPKSAVLGATAFALALMVGVTAGTAAALARRQRGTGMAPGPAASLVTASPMPLPRMLGRRGADWTLAMAAVVGVSVPSFIIASLLQYFLAYRRDWLPPAGWGDDWRQIIMPAASLAAFPAAFLSRLVRQSLLSALTADYVRTARAKGLGPLKVTLHALRNALLPALTYSGPLLAGLLTGSFVVEDIFAVPGLGKFFVSSIQDRDYTTLLGVTTFYAALLVGLNLVVDSLYSVLDPRVGTD